MRLSEIRKKYRNQWVLVEFSKLDKDLRVKDGKVLAHASSKEDIYKALLHTLGKNVAIEYCGDLPEDLVVMFCLDVTRRRAPGAFYSQEQHSHAFCFPAKATGKFRNQ